MKKIFKARFRILFSGLLFIFLLSFRMYGIPPGNQEFYQIKIYHLKQKSQEERVDNFLKQTYLPALHRAGISKVGVFKPVEEDTTYGKRIYVFIPFKSIDQFLSLSEVLGKDQQYNAPGNDYIEAAYNNPPYTRIECILLKAFINMPEFKMPKLSTPASERFYELRSYESATEKLGTKKIQMFNQGGEIKIFEKLGFNAVFYAQVLSGSRTPNLMYLTTYSDKASREEHWNAFRNDPDWKKLSSMEEYKNTVSTSQILFLHPTAYSDI
jgi:hypothetical protein